MVANFEIKVYFYRLHGIETHNNYEEIRIKTFTKIATKRKKAVS